MKLLLAAAFVLAACGPGLRTANPKPATDDYATAFVRAVNQGDVAAVRKMLGPSVVLGGLWFPDPVCAREFVGTGEAGGGRLDELARCLTTVKFATASRKDPLPTAAILTYEPGIEVEAVFTDRTEGPWLSWIGYEARRSASDGLPTISPEALESLRVAGQREPAVPEVEDEVKRSERHYAKAWVKLCIDTSGNVTGAHVREASSNRAAKAFVTAIADWKFKPFAPSGAPLPVCSLVLLANPLAYALQHENIPFPLPEKSDVGLIVPIEALHRVEGEKRIVPDDAVKTAIQKAHISRIVGSFELCIDATGQVQDVRVIQSTAVPPYDEKIERGIRRWVYEPYLDEGKPTPVCTAVTFIYSQR